MYIELSELFIYRQYKGYPINSYFDRRKYVVVVDSNHFSEYKNDEEYERYIPLFEIDEEQLQDDFIREFNNKKLLYDYLNRTVCFEAFTRSYDLWRQWWEYYKKAVYKIAEDWCRENHIKFKNSDLE